MQLSLLTVISLLVLSTPEHSLGSKILAVLPSFGRSHFIFSHSVLTGLASKGHHVTVYSLYMPQEKHENITYFQVKTEFDSYIQEKLTFETIIMVRHLQFLGMSLALHGYYAKCQFFLNNPQIQALLSSDDKYDIDDAKTKIKITLFDLVISEGSRGQESMLVFGSKFRAPNVVLWTTGAAATLNSYAGNSLSVAHIPDYFSYATTDQMTFLERTKNWLSTVFILAYYNWIHLPQHQRLVTQLAPALSHPPVSQLVSDVSLTLLNAHPVLSLPQPLTPNMVPIGGAHLDLVKAPLPQDIAEFIEGATDGVIFFSLGSMVPDHFLPRELLDVFVNVFKTLPQRVLWKITSDKLPPLSDNVLVAKWLPQQSILSHSATKLFITHGGLHSVLEAWDAGVPVVGFAVGSDQLHNIRQCERLGVGVSLDITCVTEHSFAAAIRTVLGNHSYRENGALVSERFRDVALAPRNAAVYWIEYVLRHQGAPHLRPRAAQLPLYQRALLDVIAAVLGVTLLGLWLMYRLFKRLTCSKQSDKKKLKTH